jgi:hypothetical protein
VNICIERNPVVVYELWSLALFICMKNHFRRGIPMEDQSNNITEVFAVE